MPDSIEAAVGVGPTIEIKGKEYRLSPLTMFDLAEFTGYIRTQRLKVVNSVDNFGEAEQAALRREVLHEYISDQEVLIEMTTMSGICFLLYRGLRKNEGITLEKVCELVDMSNLDMLTDVVNTLGEGLRPPVIPEEEEVDSP